MSNSELDGLTGIIFGDVTFTAILLVNGREIKRHSVSDFAEAVNWAKLTRSDILERIGDAESKKLGYSAPWELRMYS